MADLCRRRFECKRCHKQFSSKEEIEKHAKKEHGSRVWTCETCKVYQSEKKWAVERHREGCKRRNWAVRTETVGEWDISPGGTRRKDERQERVRGRRLDSQGKEVGREESGKKGNGGVKRVEQSKRVEEEGEAMKEASGRAKTVARDPPKVQRWPSLEYLTALGSPLPKTPKTPRTPRDEQVGGEESETKEETAPPADQRGKGAERGADQEDRDAEKGAGQGDRGAEASFEVNLAQEMVLRKTIRTTTYPDGRVVVEEKREVTRFCTCNST